MTSLAELPELVGFFSYSREDDQDSEGALSALRDRIQRELRGQLGRALRLWQDREAIPPGRLWESEIKAAIEQSVFFIPIVTPRAMNSKYCRVEFDLFLDREAELGRDDLVFPIHYIRVRGLEDEARWRDDPVLSVIGKRQYVDWRAFRQEQMTETRVRVAIERFCEKIIDALTAPMAPLAPAPAARAPAMAPAPTPASAVALPLAKLPLAVLPAIAESFRDGPGLPEMVVVPAGEFMMGTEKSEQESFDDERPRHPVSVTSAFAIGRYHVTRAEYAMFVEETGYTGGDGKGSWREPGFAQTDRDPAVCVSWDDANAYVAWLAKTTGKAYRLPTEAEWEYAARAGTATAWYWGDAIGSGNANCDGCGSRWDNKSTSPGRLLACNRSRPGIRPRRPLGGEGIRSKHLNRSPPPDLFRGSTHPHEEFVDGQAEPGQGG